MNSQKEILSDLSNKGNQNFIKAITKLALSKNIKLMDGTISTWKSLLITDLNRGLFDLNDFIEAIEVIIRKPAYNRLDYSDIYRQSIIISYGKFSSGTKKIRCIKCNQKHLNIEGLTENLYQASGCDRYEDIRKNLEYKEIIKNMMFLKAEYFEFKKGN